ALHARPVVPTAIENHYLSCRRHMPDVTLDVHLRFLSLRRRRQRHQAEHSGTDPFRNALDHPALTCGVAAFENDDNFESFMLDPELKLHEFSLKLSQLA